MNATPEPVSPSYLSLGSASVVSATPRRKKKHPLGFVPPKPKPKPRAK